MYKARYKKYGNKSTNYNGRKYHSKFEASGACDLDIMKLAGEILDWEPQFKVDIEIFNAAGRKVHNVSHKVDFRVTELDETFTLIEYKGFETQDYKFRRKLLEKIWLPEHPDHTYEVVYQKRGYTKY